MFVTQRCRCCHHLQSVWKAVLALTCACFILEGTYELTSYFAFLYLSPPKDTVVPIFYGIGRQESPRLKVIFVSLVETSEGQNCVLCFAVWILTSSSTIPISVVPANAVFSMLKFASHRREAGLPKTLGVVRINAEWVCAYFVTNVVRWPSGTQTSFYFLFQAWNWDVIWKAWSRLIHFWYFRNIFSPQSTSCLPKWRLTTLVDLYIEGAKFSFFLELA